MVKDITNIINDIKSLVSTYMAESAAGDLIRVLDEDIALKTNADLFPSEVERT